MTPALLAALNAITALAGLKADHTFDTLKDDINALRAKLTATLPEKLDGSDWTDADVQAAKDAADLPWHLLKAIVSDDGA